MSLADTMEDDLGTFLSTDDFAEPATYTHTGEEAVEINVIFGKPFLAIMPTEAGVDSSSPQALCATEDVESAAHGDTLVIDGTTYYVIDIQPSEDGLMTVLILSEDEA